MTDAGSLFPATAGLDGSPELERRRQHMIAAVSEGLCPLHCTPLEPVITPPGRNAGHCPLCRRFWAVRTGSGVAGWWLDHDPERPWVFSVPVPAFMRSGP